MDRTEATTGTPAQGCHKHGSNRAAVSRGNRPAATMLLSPPEHGGPSGSSCSVISTTTRTKTFLNDCGVVGGATRSPLSMGVSALLVGVALAAVVLLLLYGLSQCVSSDVHDSVDGNTSVDRPRVVILAAARGHIELDT